MVKTICLLSVFAGLMASIAGGTLLSAASFAAENDDLTLKAKAAQVFSPISAATPTLTGNEITPDRITLGQMLFFDPRLSASQQISCNSCHNLAMGGDDNLPVSLGHGWQQGQRNAPTVLNAVLNPTQFWDGRVIDLKTQAKHPLQNDHEMANTRENIEQTLLSMPQYAEAFHKAFPDDDDPVTFENMAKAIEAFEATLTTPDSPFDQFLSGKMDALTAEEKTGLSLFMDTGCSSCHNGVNVGGSGYYPFGVVERPGPDILPPGDKGRIEGTDESTAHYVFRVPPLRTVILTAPYFHSGAVWDLKDAVKIMAKAQLGTILSDNDAGSIVAFLRTLNGTLPALNPILLPNSTPTTPRPRTTLP